MVDTGVTSQAPSNVRAEKDRNRSAESATGGAFRSSVRFDPIFDGSFSQRPAYVVTAWGARPSEQRAGEAAVEDKAGPGAPRGVIAG